MNGFTLVQLTDIHVGPTIGRAFIETIVARTNALNPDIIAIPAIWSTARVEELRERSRRSAELRARHGVYFVTGNHEYFSGAAPGLPSSRASACAACATSASRSATPRPASTWPASTTSARALRRAGPRRGSRRGAGGAGPAARGRAAGASTEGGVRGARASASGLQLSGHTHGGQIWPFSYFVRLQQPFVAGLHRHEGDAALRQPRHRLLGSADAARRAGGDHPAGPHARQRRSGPGGDGAGDDAGAGSASRPT